MLKELSNSAESTPNDTELNDPNKDFKDYKESYEGQNSNIEQFINTKKAKK